jgi:peptidoglycan hydrolase CwlO-like protein
MLSFPETAVKIILVWGCLICSLPAGLQAETSDVLEDRKKKIQGQITQEQERVQAFTQKEAQLIQELDGIDFQLNRAAIRAADLTSRIRQLEETMTALGSDRQKLSDRIQERRGYAESRLAALYRMHAAGRLNMAAPPATLFDFLVNRRAMEQVVNSDYGILDDLNRDMVRLQTVEVRLREQKAAMDKLKIDLAGEIQTMTAASKKKQEILHAVQQEKKMSNAALASLKESADALDQQLAAIGKHAEVTWARPRSLFRKAV